MRALFARSIAAAMVSLAAVPAAAASHEGVVRHIRIDADADPLLCAATSPPLPGGAWACIYANRRHHQEMKALLLHALDAKHRCAFEWTHRDAATNRLHVTAVTCSAR